MRKKGIKKLFIDLSLYEGAKTRVGMDSELSEGFEVKVGINQRSVLSPFVFPIVG